MSIDFNINFCFVQFQYAVFMFILFGLQVALVVWIFIKRSQFLTTMGEIVDKAWEKNNDANGYPMNTLEITVSYFNHKIVLFIQLIDVFLIFFYLQFNCCGRLSAQDYISLGQAVPNSCCGSMTNTCPATIYLTQPGCRSQFVDFWASNTNIIRWGGIGIALVELVALIFACCLASSIRKSSSNFNQKSSLVANFNSSHF